MKIMNKKWNNNEKWMKWNEIMKMKNNVKNNNE